MRKFILLCLVVIFIAACTEAPTPVPLPTHTPYPTYTLYPTHTPFPTHTDVLDTPTKASTPTLTPSPIPPTDTAFPTATHTNTPPPTATLTSTATPLPNPEISVNHWHMQEHSFSGPSFNGEIQNTGTVMAQDIAVMFEFFDSKDRLLDTVRVWTGARTLDVGEKTGFFGSWDDEKAGWEMEKTVVKIEAWPLSLDQAYREFEIVEHELEQVTDTKFRISGWIKNVGNSDSEEVFVSATVYDDQGQVVAVGLPGWFWDLEAGAERKFEITFSEYPAENVDSYVLLAEGMMPYVPPTPTATPTLPIISSIDCSDEELSVYLESLEPLIDEFTDIRKLGQNTARIALSPVIKDLQAIERQVDDLESPDCLANAGYKSYLLNGINADIEHFLAFMSEREKDADEWLDIAMYAYRDAAYILEIAMKTGNGY